VNSLFIKIMIWFTLTQIVIAAVTNLVWDVTEPTPRSLRSFLAESTGQAMPLDPSSPMDLDRNTAMAAMLGWRESGIDFHVFNDRGGWILGTNDPSPAILTLASRAIDTGGLVMDGQEDELLLAFPSVRADGSRLIFVGAQPPITPAPTFERQVLRFGLMAPIGLLICFTATRYLTGPIRALRRVTGRVAEGDLAARVEPELGGRRDELADAGRDFDRMADRVESLIESQRRLLGDMSHELRSPLARLTVALGLARRHTGPDARDALDRIETEATRIEEMISQLLALARAETGPEDLVKQHVALGATLDEVIADARYEAKANESRIELLTTASLEIAGDPTLLRSAIENVLRNAIYYGGQGTIVRVTLDRDPNSGEARLRILDEGPGVPEDALPRLFDPFYRVSGSRDRQSGGTGLGLAIAQRVVALHGGSIGARNVGGAGLEIEIRIPLAEPYEA